LDFLEKILDDAIELKKVGRIGPGQQSSGHMLKREIRWNPEGFSWEADPSLIPKLLEGLGLEKAKGAPTPGTKDVGKDDRDSMDVLDDAERKIVQSAAGLEQYIALDRPDICDSVKTALQGLKHWISSPRGQKSSPKGRIYCPKGRKH
jgi:hypothetical protein